MEKKSVFIITYGPAGSGKGFIEDTFIKKINHHLGDKINLVSSDQLHRMQIDTYVENDRNFAYPSINHVNSMFTISELCNINIDNAINNIINGDEKKEIKLNQASNELTSLYFKIRDMYNNKNDDELKKALKDGKNIIYETTGVVPIDWLFTEPDFLTFEILQKYYVVIVYPFVDSKKIIFRAVKRFIKRSISILENKDIIPYMENKIRKLEMESVRLPILFGENSLSNMMVKSYKNLEKYINICIEQKTNYNLLLFYDNDEEREENEEVPLFLFSECGDKTYNKSICDELERFMIKKSNMINFQLMLALQKYCKTICKKECKTSMDGGYKRKMYENYKIISKLIKN